METSCDLAQGEHECALAAQRAEPARTDPPQAGCTSDRRDLWARGDEGCRRIGYCTRDRDFIPRQHGEVGAHSARLGLRHAGAQSGFAGGG
jgi:hypothetical protein